MPAFRRYSPRRNSTFGFLALVAALLLTILLAACGSSRLTTDRAYSKLKPKEQLPDREIREMPENLVIKITNVADAGKSFRNFIVLYVNGQEIAPVEKLSNFTSTYTYPMRLQHGVYEVKAEYHVVGFWREQVFDIIVDEPVKVLPDQRTLLQIKLDKDDPRPFIIEPAPEVIDSRPIVTRPAPNVIVPAPVQPVVQPAPQPVEAVPLPADAVTLQINTSPSGADVIIDDRYYGQSPVKIAVSSGQNHIVQISRAGYAEVVKILNAAELREQPLMQLLIKLEPAEAKNQN
ncbi:hypothetical protein DCC62_04085 [candidate division KSB1 bacterium]|nr:MAG: hypothetical protein DCC62_04085 [candidate division KSB1 bacterium]